MERRRIATVVLILVAASLVVGAGSGPQDPEAPEDLDNVTEAEATGTPQGDRIVQPVEAVSPFWPYTSRRRSVDGRTLALNVVIQGDVDRVERVLADRTNANWSRTDPETPLVESPWRPAHGSPRYTYVRPTEDGGRWRDADYQLGVGDYLGRQTHIRAYRVPERRTTVLQAHSEYWDWFRVRHTVTGIGEATTFVEEDLWNAGGDVHLSREYHGLRGGYSDGWISVIDLRRERPERRDVRVARPGDRDIREWQTAIAGSPDGPTADVSRQRTQTSGYGAVRRHQAFGSVAPLGAAPTALGLLLSTVPAVALVRSRSTLLDGELWRDALLLVGLAGLVLGVRTTGIVVENLMADLDPKYLSVVLYPTLALGPLALVGLLARGRPQTRAAMLAGLGFGAGIVLDLGTVGVSAVPVDVALHRIALVGALGLVAAGSSQRDRRLTALGVGAWVVGLAMPLAGFI